MRTVDAHLLEEKIDEAVTHYINSHPHGEAVHVDANSLGLNIQEENGHRVVTLMHPQSFSSQMCRQVTVDGGGAGGDGPWGEELLDPEVRIAALAAHLAQHSRVMNHQMPPQHKVAPARVEVESSVILDRLGFHGHSLNEHIVVEVPSLPQWQPIKKSSDTVWFDRAKTSNKDEGQMLSESDLTASPAAKQNKKSLPHKKRISKKLKRSNGNTTPQHPVCAEDIVVLNCNEEVHHEEILPDSYVAHHADQITDDPHIGHEVRPVFICQICSAYYGADQLKFYQHLKQHYEPHATIIIENPVTDLGIDKMTNTCIVDNVATLPDSIVELSLENTMPKTTMYQHQPLDKHILYTTSDKSLQYANKVHYSMANMEKEHSPQVAKQEVYDSLEKVELYSCTRCNRSFRKQKHCEAHIRDVHSKSYTEELNEFSEPEDLMEGIHVTVEEVGEVGVVGDVGGVGDVDAEYALPPLSDHHVAYRYSSRLSGSSNPALNCAAEPCAIYQPRETQHEPQQLKEEVFQRIFESDIEHPHFANGIMEEEGGITPEPADARGPPDAHDHKTEDDKTAETVGSSKKDAKKFTCNSCPRVFNHRNSLMYHVLSHKEKRSHKCTHCDKEFYTKGALKVHNRVHNGDRPYKCEECGRNFRQWGDLKYHNISIHTEKKHFKCEFCGKEFSRKYSLNVHRRIHTGEKNYKCEYCVKTFRASSYRLTHMRTHTGYKPHKCDQCDKCFRVCADLRRHQLTHERLRKRLMESADSQKRDKKPGPKLRDDEPVKAATKKSPAKPNILKSEKPKAKKSKKAPIVTVNEKNERLADMLKTDYNNAEPYDARYNKFKEVYGVDEDYKKDVNYAEPIVDRETRDFATLRPMLRPVVDENDTGAIFAKHENTDGKLTVFTHVEKPKNYTVPVVGSSQMNVNDIRPSLELRDGRELSGDPIESGFFERFNEAAFYNIPAV